MLKNNIIMSNKILTEYFFIFIACYSVIIQAFVNISLYSVLKYILYLLICFFIFNLIITNRFNIKNKVILGLIIIAYLNLLLGLIYSIIFNTVIIETTLMIPLILIIIGYNLRFKIKDTNLLIFCYSLSTLLVGWYIIFVFGNGFSISSQYFFPQKNQLGAILGVSVFSLMFFLLNGKNNIKIKLRFRIMAITLLFLNILPLLLLRNRTTMFAIIVIFILILIKNLKINKTSSIFKFLLVCIGFSLLLTFETVFKFLYDSFFLNFDSNDIDSLSANRVSVYIESFQFIKNNFLFGLLGSKSNIFDPHNFILYHLFKTGFILNLGVFIVYFAILGNVLKTWLSLRLSEISLSNYLLILSLVASIFEYQQPFGPGTTQLLAWLFVGNALRERKNHEERN